MKTAKRRKRESRREEKEVVDRLGGRLTFNSGAGLEKGDARVRGVYRIENKITDTPSYRLTGDEWRTLEHEAQMSGEVPLFVVRVPVPHTTGHLRLVAMPHHFAVEVAEEQDFKLPEEVTNLKPKGTALSQKRWMKYSQDGCIFLRLQSYKKMHEIIVMEWGDFCRRAGHE